MCWLSGGGIEGAVDDGGGEGGLLSCAPMRVEEGGVTTDGCEAGRWGLEVDGVDGEGAARASSSCLGSERRCKL